MIQLTDKQITRWFLAAVALVGLIYVCLQLTPSSYGFFLGIIQAPEAGPMIGASRPIRSDEWSVTTPLIQAAVRNKFQRVNETSFYREDMRNFIAVPLKDWSLIFKPQLWAFFVLSPATAYSIYYTFLMCGFLAGYYFLFCRLGIPAWLSVAASMVVYFSGFNQFFLSAPLAWFPWALLIILLPMQWWAKALLAAWIFPSMVFSQTYPALLLTLAWGGLILILAMRPALFRSPPNLAAIAIGGLATAIALHIYFAEIIPIMRDTVYPGHRVSPAGTTPILAALSEIFPSVSFRLGDYQNLTGENICEIGAVGSFFPLLALCLLRYRSVRDHPAFRKTLLILLSGFLAITLWELAPVPSLIGHILLWDRGSSQRWLFASGFLLTLASLWILSSKLISVHALRISAFVLIGPIASLIVKFAWMLHTGESSSAVIAECASDFLLCGMAVAIAAAAWYIPTPSRAPLLVLMIVFMNVYAFGRFNPLQSAWPIFDVPETDLVHSLRAKAAASPGGVLFDRSFGATLNGLGFRAPNHVLVAPQLALFRSYFPTMDATSFNQIFNRFAHVQVMPNPMPRSPQADVIEVPTEVLVPVRNVREMMLSPMEACSQTGGGIDRVTPQGTTLVIEGWAPWASETDAQGIKVLSALPLHLDSLTTITRPDIAEQLQDYGFVKSGFKLQISSDKLLRPEEIGIKAFGTTRGEVQLSACPVR